MSPTKTQKKTPAEAIFREVGLDITDDVQQLPILPLRGMLVFPYAITHLDVGRENSLKAVNIAMESEDKLILLLMQKNPKIDDPDEDDVYQMGTIARIHQILKLPGGTVRILVEGLCRGEVEQHIRMADYMSARVKAQREYITCEDLEVEALKSSLQKALEDYAKKSKKIPPETLLMLTGVEEPQRYADLIAAAVGPNLSERQQILDERCVNVRMELLLGIISKSADIIDLEQKIAARIRKQMEQNQREYYLREQIKAIQKELGEKDDRSAEVEELTAKIKKARLPKNIQEIVMRELSRLEKMPPMMAEAMVVRNYIDWILDLPWRKETKDNLDILQAEKILNEDHYGLEKPKERILEYLAGRQLTNGIKGQIICFVGPPGVGKTSLARSVARALGREFVRMSLGGVHDEAEIRGHRRTYIGAMPGRIIQNIKNAGVKNPVFLLDEIDKLGSDFRGDPSSALLEALDPEQNNTFADHYIEAPFDLSKVMFITTANVSYDIPKPLLDRMEVIYINSYTEEEKLQIAKRHLVNKQLKEHGLKRTQLRFLDSSLTEIIRSYTREAGVRELERMIAKICRRVGRDIVSGKTEPVKITTENINTYLGVAKYIDSDWERKSQVGVVTGLAWTEIGGELLQIEVQTLPGKGKMTITGQLGDVMKESAQAGFTYIRSCAKQLGIADNIEEVTDFHIHVPEGAIPKDGPSAGISMATAMASQLTGRAVRAKLAMTGEVTLRGRVLPVGGIKEKILAAHRGGCKDVILPKENVKDLEEIPEKIREKIQFHFVESMEEVLELALMPVKESKK